MTAAHYRRGPRFPTRSETPKATTAPAAAKGDRFLGLITRIDLLTVLGKLTELRDRDTAGHNLRVTLYTLLAMSLVVVPAFLR